MTLEQRNQPFPMSPPEPTGDEGGDEHSNEITLEVLNQRTEEQGSALANLTQILSNLSTTVGRVQSIADRQAQNPNLSPDLDSELDTKMSSMLELMAEMASVLDDDIVGPQGTQVKQKVQKAYADLQASVTKREAVKEFIDILKERGVPVDGDTTSTDDPNPVAKRAAELDEVQVGLIKEAQDFGIDPRDPRLNWQEAQNIVRQGGSNAQVVSFIRGKIASILQAGRDSSDGDDGASDSDAQRAARARAAAGEGTPPASVGRKSIARRLADAKTGEERRAILREIEAI